MPDESGQDLGVPSHEASTAAELTPPSPAESTEKSPGELARELAERADSLFARAEAVDPKFLTDRGTALGGNGVGIDTYRVYASTGRGADVLKVSDAFGFTPLREAAMITRWRVKQEDRDLPPGELTGSYDFEQFAVGKPITNSRIVMERGPQTIGFLGGQKEDVGQSVAHSSATIKRIEEAVSVAEQRQSAASQQPKPTNQG
ncbi:MAG: hypothetical protein CO135_00095 [Candidatus Levybacteria bacterium CG_4_9_14_3_um_filter_35_16]|nr:MAG: hypothetical protein COW87_02780 [Candidatus Levybacteria bacterium CG22_combo_CG10-13_8_21_14_all_35_11]PJA91651.1 MAG: hypothetical protein CO135_00095 [Candidatus Levybacteria bacterium CG_4_9_14_3_um_filter_35_16]PJC54835.1 MAG: hypothetical protein CO028_00405 [Candidatus Levybacteria bacterium CG_4_9_14_0_2_um_filter_35_21]